MKKDYCTGCFDRLFGKDWSECCKKHDEDYGLLIDKDRFSTKEQDLKFLKCLKEKTWLPLAYVMYGVVRLFGEVRIKIIQRFKDG